MKVDFNSLRKEEKIAFIDHKLGTQNDLLATSFAASLNKKNKEVSILKNAKQKKKPNMKDYGIFRQKQNVYHNTLRAICSYRNYAKLTE